MSLYVFNKQQEVIKIIPYRRIIALTQEQELNSTDELILEIPNEDWLTMGEEPSYMAVKDVYSRYSYHLYKVIQDKTGTHTSEIRGIQVGFDELKAYGYIKDRRFSSYSVRRVAEVIVEGTEWELGYVSDSLPTVSTNFYYISRLESLSKLIELTGAEVQFRVEINGNKISAKRMDLYEKLGKDTGKRFAYGDRLLSVTKETDNVGVVTALVGRGRGEETETGGFGRKITFTDVEWGDDKPVVKPRGQEYVEIPEMTALYGYKDGTPRYGIAEFNDTEDPEELLEQTYRALVDMSRPQVQFKASVQVVGDLGLGDTVAIIRKDVGIMYKTRVYKVSRDLLDNTKTVVELGDKVGQSLGKTLGKIESTIRDQREDIITIVQTAANGKNKIFRGEQEPTSGMMVGDLWYKPIADGEVEMYQWNGTIWELIITSGISKELEEALDKAHKAIEEVRARADKAVNEIDEAVKGAGFTSLDETIRNNKDLAIKAQEDAQNIIDNKGTVLGLDSITGAIEEIENPASDTWKDILESDSGYIVQYTTENNEGVLSSAYTQTSGQITSALTEYTEDELDANIKHLLVSESSQTAGELVDRLSAYTTHDDLGVVSTTVNEVKRTADSNTTSIVDMEKDLNGDGDSKYTRFSTIEHKVTGLQTTVGDESKGLVSQYNQLAEGFRSTVENVNGLSTTVGQLSDKWVMTLEDGDDIITAINASRDGVYVKGEKIVLDGDTTIAGSFTVTDTIFANKMNISKFTTGTLDASNVNIINLNAQNIVGVNADLIRASFSAATGGETIITGHGVKTMVSPNGEYSILEEGGVRFYQSDGTLTGSIETGYQRISGGRSVGIFIRPGMDFTVTRYYDDRDNFTPFRIEEDDTIKTYSEVIANRGLEVHQGINVSGTSELGRINIYSSGDGERSIVGNTEGGLNIYAHGKIYMAGSELVMRSDINMSTYSIINQSDIRLKKDITESKVNAIREIERLEFIEYLWDKSKRPNSPDGKQFGIKAQYAPFLQEKADGEDSYLSIDMNKQVNLNSKAIQEVIAILKNNNLMGEI